MSGRRGPIRRRLKTVRRYLVAAGARATIAVLGLLPFALSKRVFRGIASIVATPFLRGQIDANLVRAYGAELDPTTRRAIARRVCANVGLIAAEVLAQLRGRLPAGYLRDDAVLGHMRKVLERGKGIIFVTSHLGNWELLGAWAHVALGEYGGAVVARRNANERLDSLILDARTRMGMRTIYQDESLRRAVRELRAGRFVALVPDQDIDKVGGIFVPFFGQPAYTPTGPAALALLADTPILPVFSRREGNALVMELGAEIVPDPRAERDGEIRRLTEAWSAEVEAAIRRDPSGWMWFHRRWRTTEESLARKREARRAATPDSA